MTKTRILIVEDEMIVALDLEDRLLSMGYDVVGCASSGEEAVRKALEIKPDLALMDIILRGGIDGIEAAERIQQTLPIPIIFLTASTDDGTVQRAKLTGPFGYVLKPFEDRELYGHIEITRHRHRLEERLRKSEERYALAARGANDGLWDWDLTTGQIFYSARWETMLGYEEGEFADGPTRWFEAIHPEDRDRVHDELQRHLEGRATHFQSEYRILHRNGNYRWMLTRGLALRDDQGVPCRIAGSQSDITERKVYDPITGMPNHTLFADRLERAIERASRDQSYGFGVLAIEIANLATIKDTVGHAASDRLLVETARELQNALTPSDSVASIGDGNFLVLLDDIENVTKAARIASKLQSQLSRVFDIDRQRVCTTACVGVAFHNGKDSRGVHLISQAQTAMRRAANNGNRRCEVFDAQMRALALNRLQMEADLRGSVERGDFPVHFQPIISLEDGGLVGFEALVRWEREPGKLVSPGEFIGLAEETNLIVPIETLVLRTACSKMKGWQDSGLFRRPALLNVNLSPRHYVHPNLLEEIRDTLHDTGFQPQFLQLEITESALVEDTETILSVLKQICDLRIRLHMDDFGTGYSSLSYLHRFPISALKIDQSFVRNVMNREDTRKIVQTIITLGRSLGLQVTAEGVELPDQVGLLQELGCHHAQGFLFARPADPSTIPALVAEQPWLSYFPK